MPTTEATARIKINRLLEAAGWRLLPENGQAANVCLEQGTEMTLEDVWRLGDDFQETERGFIDFLLLDERGFPFIVLEAKSESKDPLDAKEQARRYARSQNCRFVILSNGNLHYLWDLERGKPAKRLNHMRRLAPKRSHPHRIPSNGTRTFHQQTCVSHRG